MNNYILEMKQITKKFPSVVALDDVNLSIKRGEVHALVGENGAGKSTLMKVLNGVHKSDEGEIYIDGSKVDINNTDDAKEKGIGLIFQEFNLVNQLSGAENIYLNRLKKRGGRINWQALFHEAQSLADSYGFDIDITLEVNKLSTAQRQLLEILKVLSQNAKIIVMDEPTSSLTLDESDNLLEIIKTLKTQGITIIYISHKLEEVFEICDRCTVIRDGKTIETRNTSDFSREEIIELMVGRSVEMEYPQKECPIGDVVLEVKNLTKKGMVEDISFQLSRGEILGIAGLVGSGRTELAELIFGAKKKDFGEIHINGKLENITSTFKGKRAGIGLLTEDRKETGLVLEYGLIENISITNLKKVKTGIFISSNKEKEATANYKKDLNIKTPTMKQLAINLSGGNQQKVVFAKWLFSDAEILILDEPTRGIDVGAKYEIYLLMNQLAKQGKAIIMISSELPEVLGMSDRVLVLNEGKLKGELLRKDATPKAVMALAISN